ncbi:MAG: M20/M25/M40 family metallo-hydrolase [Bacteroidales bacterium]
MRKALYIKLFAILTIAVTHSFGQNPAVTISELEEHIEFLASEELSGRFPGTEGDKKAADYIRAQFKQANLDLAEGKGFQKFTVVTGNLVEKSNTIKLDDYEGQQYKDFVPFPFSGSDTINNKPVVFAGYGFDIENEHITWNDYENLDVKDSWVIILRGYPNIGDKKKHLREQSSDKAKASKAFDKGACGVFFVAGDKNSDKNSFVNPDIRKGSLEIPVVHIKTSFADKIIENSGTNIQTIKTQIEKTQNPKNFNTEQTLSSQIAIQPKEVTTQNIIAEIDINSDDYIVIGAHYDHLGTGGLGSGSRQPDTTAVHYGADDNASGVAAMLEIAEKLNHEKESLESNFLFIAFGAEEKGLIGSKYFVNNPAIELDKVKAMINIDMIGRLNQDDELQIGGVGTSEHSEQILDSINLSYNYQTGYSHEGYGPSDHSSFYSKEIPVFFFSTGPHFDYHTPADDTDKINYSGIQKISEYIYDLIKHLNMQSIALSFQETGAKDEEKEVTNKKKLKVTLGIMPDFAGVVDKGLRADIVINGKPADKAGMENGDIITAINGHEIKDIYDYMEKLSDLEPGQTINVEIQRDGEKKVFLVQL